jgi:hypothetical protein
VAIFTRFFAPSFLIAETRGGEGGSAGGAAAGTEAYCDGGESCNQCGWTLPGKAGWAGDGGQGGDGGPVSVNTIKGGDFTLFVDSTGGNGGHATDGREAGRTGACYDANTDTSCCCALGFVQWPQGVTTFGGDGGNGGDAGSIEILAFVSCSAELVVRTPQSAALLARGGVGGDAGNGGCLNFCTAPPSIQEWGYAVLVTPDGGQGGSGGAGGDLNVTGGDIDLNLLVMSALGGDGGDGGCAGATQNCGCDDAGTQGIAGQFGYGGTGGVSTVTTLCTGPLGPVFDGSDGADGEECEEVCPLS